MMFRLAGSKDPSRIVSKAKNPVLKKKAPSTTAPVDSNSKKKPLQSADSSTISPQATIKPQPTNQTEKPKVSKGAEKKTSQPNNDAKLLKVHGEGLEHAANGTIIDLGEQTKPEEDHTDTRPNWLQEAAQAAAISKDVTTAIQLGGRATSVATQAAPSTLKTITSTAGKALPAAGAVLLVASGSARAVNGETVTEKAAGVSDVGWGVQLGAEALAKTGSAVAKIGAAAGVVGGGIQAGLGIKEGIEGIKEKNLEKIGLGALETAGGAAWALGAATVIAPQVAIPVFVIATGVSKGIRHRKVIKKAVSKATTYAKEKFHKLIGKGKAKNERVADLKDVTPATSVVSPPAYRFA